MADTSRPTELNEFVWFATVAFERTLDVIAKHAPQSTERWNLYHSVCPRSVDPKQTPLNLAIAEVRQNNEGNLLAPRLERLHAALREFMYAAMDYPQGSNYTKRTGDGKFPEKFIELNDAINALMPYIGSTVEPASTSDENVEHASSADDTAEPASTTDETVEYDAGLLLSGLPDDAFIFALFGSFYVIAGFGEKGAVRRLKGFECLSKLVARPGVTIRFDELERGPSEARVDQGGSQPIMDKEYVRSVREEIAEYDEALRVARQNGNIEEEAELLKEREALIAAVGSALGLGGKVRDLNAGLRRHGSRIHNALSRARGALRCSCPPMSKLADHFQEWIRREGGVFVYEPTPPIEWQLTLPNSQKKYA